MHDNRKLISNSESKKSQIAETIRKFDIKPGQPMKTSQGIDIMNSSVISDHAYMEINDELDTYRITSEVAVTGEEEVMHFGTETALHITSFMMASANIKLNLEATKAPATYASPSAFAVVGKAMAEKEIYQDFLEWGKTKGLNSNIHIYLTEIGNMGNANPREWMELSNLLKTIGEDRLDLKDVKGAIGETINDDALEGFIQWQARLLLS